MFMKWTPDGRFVIDGQMEMFEFFFFFLIDVRKKTLFALGKFFSLPMLLIFGHCPKAQLS